LPKESLYDQHGKLLFPSRPEIITTFIYRIHPTLLSSLSCYVFLALMPKRILIVEDEISVRNAVRVFLEHHSSFEVCGEATNGVEAVDKATALQPDLVILDLSMPHMNGIEAASLLRSRLPLVPIVVYTMFGDVLGKSLAAALGVAAIVSKSDGLTILVSRIESLLASTPLAQPRVG
jgi:DNA-binding NarL/FixJ family response regulator